MDNLLKLSMVVLFAWSGAASVFASQTASCTVNNEKITLNCCYQIVSASNEFSDPKWDKHECKAPLLNSTCDADTAVEETAAARVSITAFCGSPIEFNPNP